MINFIRKEIEKVRQKLSHAIRRGILTVVGNDYFNQVSCYNNERLDEVELWQHYGFCSIPTVGTRVVTVAPNGSSANAVSIAERNRGHRIDGMESGDVCIYSAKNSGSQHSIFFDSDGSLFILPRSGDFLKIGSGTDFIVKGTTFNLANATMLNLLAAAFNELAGDAALAPATKSKCTAAAVGITAFLGSASTWLSTKGKTS